MESVGARSVGSNLSFHGTHAGGINASSVGTSDDSFTVHVPTSTSWYNVTDHCQPSYPRTLAARRKSVTLSSSSMVLTTSPTCSGSSATLMATARARSRGSGCSGGICGSRTSAASVINQSSISPVRRNCRPLHAATSPTSGSQREPGNDDDAACCLQNPTS